MNNYLVQHGSFIIFVVAFGYAAYMTWEIYFYLVIEAGGLGSLIIEKRAPFGQTSLWILSYFGALLYVFYYVYSWCVLIIENVNSGRGKQNSDTSKVKRKKRKKRKK